MISQPFTRQNAISNAFIALGANDPDDIRLLYLRLKACIRDIASENVMIRSSSRFFRTPCFPIGAGPDFINGVVKLETDFSANALLNHLHDVEHKHARVRSQRWGPRTLDIDLLAFDDLVLPDERTYDMWRNLPLHDQKNRVPDQLILPHPRIQDRGFVLVPWGDIAPHWRHPISGLTVQKMLASIDPSEVQQIVPLSDPELS